MHKGKNEAHNRNAACRIWDRVSVCYNGPYATSDSNEDYHKELEVIQAQL